MMSTPAPDSAAYIQEFAAHHDAVAQTAPTRPVRGAQTYFEKMQNFEKSHPEDVFLPPADLALLVGTFKRIDRVQSLVGHGNFNVLSFDEMLKFSKRYSRVGAFEQDEVRFIESMFHESAQRYGFFGNKVTDRITAVVTERERYKVPYTGHFLYRGAPLDLYRKLERDLEKRVVLTSGIRSVVKQTHLFLAKTIAAEGNLSRASRSLAPPGHSYHGIGDFDVGKVGFGRKNFTTAFARTEEYHTPRRPRLCRHALPRGESARRSL